MTLTDNKNFASPNKFKWVFANFPNIQFFSKEVPLPAVMQGLVRMDTSKPIPYYETASKIIYEDLQVTFLLDEDFYGLREFHEWLVNAHTKNRSEFNPFADGTLIILTSNQNKNFNIVFHNMIPESMSRVDLNTAVTEDNPIELTVTFKYSHYVIKDKVTVL